MESFVQIAPAYDPVFVCVHSIKDLLKLHYLLLIKHGENIGVLACGTLLGLSRCLVGISGEVLFQVEYSMVFCNHLPMP